MEKKHLTPLKETPDKLWIEDEMTVYLQTDLKRVIAPKGSKPERKVRFGEYSKRVSVYISLSRAKSHQKARLVVDLQKGLKSAQFKHHLAHVRRVAGPGRLTILLDNSGAHHAKNVAQFLRKKGMHPLFLPPYTPEMNAVEEINRQLRRYLGNFFFQSEREIKDRILAFFREKHYFIELGMLHYLS